MPAYGVPRADGVWLLPRDPNATPMVPDRYTEVPTFPFGTSDEAKKARYQAGKRLKLGIIEEENAV